MLFLLNLLIPIASFSQNIYPKILNDSLVVITQQQLKQTNLIFIEHNKYSKITPLLENKIKLLNKNLELNDSIYNIQINVLEQKLNTKNKQYNKLKFWGLGINLSLILFLILK